MDIINVKIKIKNNDLVAEEKADLIINNLRYLADMIESVDGNVQHINSKDEDSTIEYVHLIQN